MSRGPLAGLKVVEFAGLAPAPFACMLLADLGADVMRVDRAVASAHGPEPAPPAGPTDILGRGRRSIAVDLKSPAGQALVMGLIAGADVLVEGFRPGVMERLGLGPAECLARNPRLVYGRMTGWGQDGPMARAAGHDIDYIALAGALHLIGREGERPVPPANLLGDFAGGGLLLSFGILAALFERAASGLGQVVDAAMVDGAALFTTFLHGLRAAGAWTDRAGVNLLDGGAAFYDTYETADGKYVAVGAVEPQFYAELLERIGLDVDPGDQLNPTAAEANRSALAARFRQRTRDDWAADLQTTDACVAPVLSLAEAPAHAHNRARAVFVEVGGVVQPAPAPRFSRTPAPSPQPPPPPGGTGRSALGGWPVPPDLIDRAVADGALVDPALAARP